MVFSVSYFWFQVSNRVQGEVSLRDEIPWHRCLAPSPSPSTFSEHGTHTTVKAKIWPWLAGKSPQSLLRCSLLARQRTSERCISLASSAASSSTILSTQGDLCFRSRVSPTGSREIKMSESMQWGSDLRKSQGWGRKSIERARSRVEGWGFRVLGFGFWVLGFGFRIEGVHVVGRVVELVVRVQKRLCAGGVQ